MARPAPASRTARARARAGGNRFASREGEFRTDRPAQRERLTLTPAARAGAPFGDARLGVLPAGIERVARLVEIDHHRRVIRRDRFALARLAIDLGPDDARREHARDQAMI